MFWMLLPPDANAGRHLVTRTPSASRIWPPLVYAVWEAIVRLFSASRR